MKNGNWVLLFFAVWGLTGCQPSGYTIGPESVSYYGGILGKDRVVEGADPKTFEVLSVPYFGKDQSSVFYKSHRLEGCSPATVQVLNRHYLKDENAAFYCERRDDDNGEFAMFDFQGRIACQDPVAFKVLGDFYATDGYGIYYQEKALPADVGSHRILKDEQYWCYLADKNHVWLQEKQLPQSHGPSFTLLENANGSFRGYGKDRAHVYLSWLPIEGADPNTFEVIGSDFSKDKNTVYNHTMPLNGLNPSTVKVEYGYAFDGSVVYCGYQLLEDVDVATFEVTGLGKAKDAKGAFLGCERVAHPK